VTTGRLLAVDWGERRIGLALSDETQVLAQPLTTLTRRAGKRFPMAQLLEQVTKHNVVGIVVGLPLNEREKKVTRLTPRGPSPMISRVASETSRSACG